MRTVSYKIQCLRKQKTTLEVAGAIQEDFEDGVS